MSKKLLTLALGCGLFASQGLYAQLPVSTSPENKNVVLEEFTGIHCGFCPDGHLKANNFAAANPGDVVLINIHAGPFATPSATEPDFRTTYGAAIDGISNVAGYPAGNINRRVFAGLGQNAGGMAMSRGSWANAGGTVLSEASYVNIAIEGDIDITTNIITVDVEMYFTANAPSDVNLNVALLQNNINGPQSGSSGNPSYVNPDGTYRHMHMLRDLLTGQWGEVITTTTSGTTVTRQYIYTIPADFNGVPVSIGDLEIVAFVAEGQTDIITGTEGPINFTAPAGSVVADLAASAAMITNSDFCNPNFTPEVSISNNSNQVASNFDVSYTVNGGTPVVQNVSASLNGGASTTITFTPITLSAGVNTIEYEVSTANNNSLFDLSAANNVSTSEPVIVVPSTPFGTYWYESFESYALMADNFQHGYSINPDGFTFGVMNETIDPSVTGNLGAYAQSANSLIFDFYTASAGGSMSLMWEKLDLSGTTGNKIVFDLAYAQYSTENDRLTIEVSSDCGATWNSVYNKAGSSLSTRSALTSYFLPGANDWRTETVNLSAYDGSAELMIRFTGISDYGNNLYVDNVQFQNNTYVGLEESKVIGDLRFYPNPAESNLYLEYDLSMDAMVSISIIDVTGSEVISLNEEQRFEGSQSQVIPVAQLAAGTYFLRINIDGVQTVEKLMIK